MRLTLPISIATFITLALAPLPAMASETSPASVVHDAGLWAPVSLKFPIWRKFRGYMEWQPRWQKNTDKHFTESIIRTGLGCDFNRHISVYGGYYITTLFNPTTTPEHRAWEQLQISHKLGKVSIQHRLRLEEIWRQTWTGASWRARDQIKLTYPLGKSHWYAIASEEPLFNLNTQDHGPKQGFTQNRLFFGFGREVANCVRLECGYLNQYRNSTSSAPDHINHMLVASIAIDLTRIQRRNKSNSKLASNPVRGPVPAVNQPAQAPLHALSPKIALPPQSVVF